MDELGTRRQEPAPSTTGRGGRHESTHVGPAETRPEATKDATGERGPGPVRWSDRAPPRRLSAALGLVSLTGSWLGTVAAARETLLGQLETAADAGVATQVKEIYGDAWHTSALWGGLFALTALIVGVVVLARPAFGTPGRTVQAPWTKSVAWGGRVARRRRTAAGGPQVHRRAAGPAGDRLSRAA
ncbi:hypothetical protein GCM10023238_16460 [Streptomyces heliomycini]